MSGASPQSHDASGWGSSKTGTSSQWYHEWAPHPSQFLNPPPHPHSQFCTRTTRTLPYQHANPYLDAPGHTAQ